MSKRMRMDVFVFQAGTLCGAIASCPKNLGRDRTRARVPRVTGKQPVRRLSLQPAPVDAKRIEQPQTEHDVTVLAALSATDVNNHALTVDIADFQVRHFGAACARGMSAFRPWLAD